MSARKVYISEDSVFFPSPFHRDFRNPSCLSTILAFCWSSYVPSSHMVVYSAFTERWYDGSARSRCSAVRYQVVPFPAFVKNLVFSSSSLSFGLAMEASWSILGMSLSNNAHSSSASSSLTSRIFRDIKLLEISFCFVIEWYLFVKTSQIYLHVTTWFDFLAFVMKLL